MGALQELLKGIDNTKKQVKNNLKFLAEDPAAYLEIVGGNLTEQLQDPMNFIGKGAGATKVLYHGGRPFTVWDPKTIGTGERSFLAQGPGLYAGNEELARIYKKYGGSDPALTRLTVEDSTIIQPAKKLTEEERALYDKAVKAMDSLGLRGSKDGLPNVFLNGRYYNNEEVRQALEESGLGGLKQNIGNYGYETVIFDPKIIKKIERVE